MLMELYFDGLCEPKNPGGIACYGWLITRASATLVSGHGVATSGPGATNNVAEYAALIAGLEALGQMNISQVTVKGDSQLVINQVNGEWTVRSPNIIPLYQKAIGLVERLVEQGYELRFIWVPREQNTAADALSREAYQEARKRVAA
jgi:ribonuclease HI